MYAFFISRLTLFAFAMCLAGAGMLITGLVPEDKMNKVRAALGDNKAKYDNQPPVRVQLLVGGAVFTFIGLLMLGVIRL